MLQIDDESIVYSLRRAGKLTCSQNTFGLNDYVGMLDITGYSNPIAAIQSSTACAAEIVRPKGEFLPYGSNGRTYLKLTCNSVNAQIQYYIFDQWVAPRGNSGVEVYDSSGNVVFHSDWYLMDVVDFLNVPAGNPTRSNTYTAGTVGSNRAIAKTLNRVWNQAGQGGAPSTHKEAVKISGGNAVVSYVFSGDYGNSAGFSLLQKIDNKLIVIDTSRLPANYG
ncbi:hypothetical protein [Salinicola sp. CR57]|uniref:hypothetical protein n=1 Tax=Salinicola sp. CR57 TaxID=1949086 RepID=UPI001300A6EB|nr:hypothetical protein [Salinicola sp. CR57]